MPSVDVSEIHLVLVDSGQKVEHTVASRNATIKQKLVFEI